MGEALMDGACDDSRICEELLGVKERVAFHDLYQGDPPSRVVHETSSFAVLCDLAPLVEGHILLVPRAHFLSMGAVPRELWPELVDLALLCERNLADLYGSPVVLEHGSSSDVKRSACVSHAHWHFIPRDLPLLDAFHRDGLTGIEIAAPSDLIRYGLEDQSYVYYRRVSTGTMWVSAERPTSRRHQYVRNVVGGELGIADPEWDWVYAQQTDVLRRSHRRLTGIQW